MMKRLVCLLALATFAAVAPGYGQSATDDAVNSMSTIKRPTPKSGPSTPANATGPLEVGLYKDAKGKEAATTFARTETVYLACKNVSGKKGDKLTATWFGDKGKKLTSASNTLPDTGTYNPTFNLPPAKSGFPPGAYSVELSLNAKVLKKESFTVK